MVLPQSPNIDATAFERMGIAQKSMWDIREHLTDGSFVPVLSEYAIAPEWNVWAVRPPARLSPARVRVFTNFLETKLREYESKIAS